MSEPEKYQFRLHGSPIFTKSTFSEKCERNAKNVKIWLHFRTAKPPKVSKNPALKNALKEMPKKSRSTLKYDSVLGGRGSPLK